MSCAVEGRDEIRPLAAPERHAQPLAFDDQAHRDALHPSGRACALADLAPEHRRDLVADEAVEHAPSFLRLDELHVEIARRFERGLDRAAGDLVEDHPLHRHLGLQHLEHVPGDRLALAILVRREDELVGVLQRALQVGDDLLLSFGHDVLGGEVVVDVDREPGAREIADVADARLDVVARAEEARDGLSLRR